MFTFTTKHILNSLRFDYHGMFWRHDFILNIFFWCEVTADVSWLTFSIMGKNYVSETYFFTGCIWSMCFREKLTDLPSLDIYEYKLRFVFQHEFVSCNVNIMRNNTFCVVELSTAKLTMQYRVNFIHLKFVTRFKSTWIFFFW